MSTDALAQIRALVRELNAVPDLVGTADWSYSLAELLHSRGVVVLPADHPLRTGQPSEAMVDAAAIESQKWVALNSSALDDKMRKVLRAALAVLREPLDK